MKKFRTKNKIRSKLIIKYIFILLFFYIIIRLCISFILKIPIYYMFDNYKIKKYKDYIIDYTINKPKYMLSYYEEDNSITNTIDSSYVYNTKPIIYIYNTHQTEKYVGGKSVLDASLFFKEELKKYNIDTIVEQRNIPEFLHKNNIPFDRSYYGVSLLIKDVINKNDFSIEFNM